MKRELSADAYERGNTKFINFLEDEEAALLGGNEPDTKINGKQETTPFQLSSSQRGTKKNGGQMKGLKHMDAK